MDIPEEERSSWQTFGRVRFEKGTAAVRCSKEDVLLRLDWPAYFDLLGVPAPDGHDATLEVLERAKLIVPCEAGGFNITNLGAILLARNLRDFPRLQRKALRVVEYRGTGRLETLREREEAKGYAAGFAELMDYIDARLPTREVNGRAFQRSMPDFPPLAVRELVVNALIHQDFSVTGAGPTVEIFEGRLEITNATAHRAAGAARLVDDRQGRLRLPSADKVHLILRQIALAAVGHGAGVSARGTVGPVQPNIGLRASWASGITLRKSLRQRSLRSPVRQDHAHTHNA